MPSPFLLIIPPPRHPILILSSSYPLFSSQPRISLFLCQLPFHPIFFQSLSHLPSFISYHFLSFILLVHIFLTQISVFVFISSRKRERERMEQLIQQQQQQQRSDEDISSALSAPIVWKDPLQMLAKQCDTISGGTAEEQRATAAKGRGKNGGREATGDGGGTQQQQQQQAAASGKGTTPSGGGGGRKASTLGGTNNGTIQQQQNGAKALGAAHFGEATPKLTAQQKAKAKSPNKVDHCSSSPSTAAFLHASPPAASFLSGASFAPPPAHLAAAMMAGGFLGIPPHFAPPSAHHRPPPPHQQFAPSAIGMPNGGQSSHPFGLNNAMMQQLMAAAMQQHATTQQQMVQPQQLMPQLFNSTAGVPLPPNVMLKKCNQQQQQQMDAASAVNMAMAMFPVDGFQAAASSSSSAGGGTFLPPNGSSSSMPNGGDGLSAFGLSIPALLMACASGQLPQGCLACSYRLKDGQLCGSVFSTEEQLFAHYKHAHIGKQSSPNVVSSTTSQGEQSVGTATVSCTPTAPTTSAGKKGSAGSPNSSRSTPTQQTTNKVTQSSGRLTSTAKAHSNPGAMFCNNGTGWSSSAAVPPGVLPMGPPLSLQAAMPAHQWKETATPHNSAGANQRFHPYAQPSSGKFALQNGQQAQHSNLQQMAMAINNLGLMANLGALPAGFFPSGADFALLAQQQLGLGPTCFPPVGMHPSTPPATSSHQQSSQLAALAAMANSIGSTGTTPTGTTARQQQQTGGGGVPTLEAVDG